MSKRFFFLTSIILALSFCATLKAGPIDDPNYNLGFELMYDANDDLVENDCHRGLDGVPGWVQGGTGAYAGVDVNCGMPDHCGDCRGWIALDEGWSHCYISTDATAYQLFDPNYDANVILTEGRQYTVTFDPMAGNYETEPVYMDVSIFYVDDPNFPDVNRHELARKSIQLIGYSDSNGLSDWQYDEVIKFVAEAGGSYLGLPLGVEFENVGPAGYLWLDNVRLEWGYATYAYEPSPTDGEVDVSRDATLNWKAGGYTQSTDGHDVYFGTDYDSVRDADELSAEYKGSFDLDVNYYDPTPLFEQLDLGQAYYWRVDEVNDAYTAGWQPGDEPPAGPWVGDVWSFEVTGYATNPSPANGEVDIPFFNLTLSWEAATSATSYDVYFGADYNGVRDANDSGSPGPTEIYRSHQSGLSYLVPESFTTGLDVGQTYYWRIDPVGGADLTGHIWSFTIGQFLIVDDMESYDVSINKIYDTWEDGFDNGSGSFVSLIYNDPNYMRSPDSQSMELEYDNGKTGATFDSSYVDANPADLIIGTDWTVGGVKSITLFWLGDPGNVIPAITPALSDYDAVRPWLELEDTSANTHLVKYGDLGEDMNNIQVAEWHQWDISLEDYNSAGVTLSSLARVTIGIGGTAYTGQSKASEGLIWIDDIRLYPPRCFPEYAHEVGNFNDDCIVDEYDLSAIGRDWLMASGMSSATEPHLSPLVEYLMNEGADTAVANSGSLGASHDLTIGEGYDEPTDPNNDPQWVVDPCRGTCLFFDGGADVNGDYLVIPALNMNSYATLCAWIYPIPHPDTGEQRESFTGLIHQRDASTIAGLSYGSGTGFIYNRELGYVWNDNDSATWGFGSDIFIPDYQWSFVAVVVEATQATVYLSDANSLLMATNPLEHATEEFDGRTLIAGDRNGELRYFRGYVDDVRIYNEPLAVDEIMYLGEVPGEVWVDLAPWRADLNNDDVIDFKDYAMFADNWMKEFLWPF
jgi:hypothetical protein